MTSIDDLAALILARSGVEVPASSPQLGVVLRERVKALGLEKPERYVRHLERLGSDDPEWQRLIQAVTNHLTHFFRDPEQLGSVAQVIEDLARHRSLGEPLRVWSAGCATGEEVYTLAIIAHQHDLTLQLYGTDVSRHAIEVARRGVYDKWSLRHVASDIKRECFSKIGAKSYQVRPEIARMAQFHEHNLVRQPPITHRGRKWDIIICRNVLIYYSPSAARKILTSFTQTLVHNGALMLGASESILSLELPLRVEVVKNRVVYYLNSSNRDSEHSNKTPPGRPSATVPQVSPDTAAQHSRAPISYIDVQADLLSLLGEGDLERAERMLKELTSNNRADSIGGLSLGHIHLMKHEFEPARECNLEVIQREPVVAEAHFFVGIVERRCQRLEAAFAALRRAVFLEPHFWAASYLLGATASRLGRQAVCKTEWRRTLSLLSQGDANLPLLTHPMLHARFLEAPERVMEICRAGIGR